MFRVVKTPDALSRESVAVHRLGPVLALDGLRGLAVAAVVLFHFPTNPAVPGGQFGVDVFFVLSGFLVTAGLMDEMDKRGDVAFGSFLRRRGRRLLPALVAFLAIYLVMAAFFHGNSWFTADPLGSSAGAPIPFVRALKGTAAALLYVFNIALIQHWPVSMPLAHLWTLAIEGQFYVVWALVLRAVLRHRRGVLLPLTLVLIVASAVLPWVVWDTVNRAQAETIIYFGTLTRLQQLLAGAALAQVWRRGLVDRLPYRWLRVAAAFGGSALLIICFHLGNQTFKYLGALTFNAGASVAVIGFLLVARAGAVSVAVLSSAPLRWLGLRSYAIYLWHWPLAVWTEHFDHAIGVPLGIAGALLLAELSWRLVEQPVRSGSPPRELVRRLLARSA